MRNKTRNKKKCGIKRGIKIAPGTSTWYNKTENTQTNNKRHTHTHTMEKIKTADKASILNTKAKSTKVGLKETESNRVSIADNNEWC